MVHKRRWRTDVLSLMLCNVLVVDSFIAPRSSVLDSQQRTCSQSSGKAISSTLNEHDIITRKWQDGEEGQIMQILLKGTPFELSGFDPEGPLSTDVANAKTIRESYDPKDGGCMLVAIDPKDGNIVGTAGLIVGTPVTYFQSGTSVSTGTVTGAARRVCAVDGIDEESCRAILTKLLVEIERRAISGGATELIILAYSDAASNRRPNATLLESLGYSKLPPSLGGLDAVQYCKELTKELKRDADNTGKVAHTASNDGSDISSGGVDAVLGTSFIAIIIFAAYTIANFMGVGLSQSSDNRGIGTPLSVEELQRLKQDEELQRTDLDGRTSTFGGNERQWRDLSPEEQREEAALMKIIQGKDVRSP